jgi:diguanylate cyclase (GGDEF)-like protein
MGGVDTPSQLTGDARAMARALALMGGIGTALACVSIALNLTPDQSRGIAFAVCVVGIPMAVATWFLPPPPPWFFAWVGMPFLLAQLTLGMLLCGSPSNPAVTYFIGAAVYSFYFFPRSIACFHLAVIGVMFGGALLVLAPTAEAIDRWMLTLGPGAAMGFLVAHLRDRLADQARADWLTGARNRRWADERIDELLAAGTPFGLLLVDIDNFKSLNDAEGHDAGDRALQKVAAALAEVAGAANVARFGGDEFVAIVPAAAAVELGELGASVRRVLGRDPLAPTLSIGAALAPAHGASAHELIRSADAALYAAKRAGRDRVVSAPARTAAGRSW